MHDSFFQPTRVALSKMIRSSLCVAGNLFSRAEQKCLLFTSSILLTSIPMKDNLGVIELSTLSFLGGIFIICSIICSHHSLACMLANHIVSERANFFGQCITIKAALADRKKVVKTGSISMGRGRCMGRGSAGQVAEAWAGAVQG